MSEVKNHKIVVVLPYASGREIYVDSLKSIASVSSEKLKSIIGISVLDYFAESDG